MKGKELKEYIIENNRCEDILNQIGMLNIDNRGSYISCTFPDGDNTCGCLVYPSLYIKPHTRDIENKQGYTPDLFDLVEFITKQASMPYIMDYLGLSNTMVETNIIQRKDGLDVFRRSKKRKKRKETVVLPDEILERYNKECHILLVQDGILPQVALQWEVGLDIESERITFIHRHWHTGKILAVIGRTILPTYKELNIKKYMLIAGKGYFKSENLYGLYQNKENIKQSKSIIFVEGEKSVIKLWQYGYKNAVSVGCHDISDSQIAILSLMGLDEITIAFDADVETDYILTMCKKLEGICKKVTYIDVSKIPIFQDKKAPMDCGIRRWRALYNHRKSYENKEDI